MTTRCSIFSILNKMMSCDLSRQCVTGQVLAAENSEISFGTTATSYQDRDRHMCSIPPGKRHVAKFLLLIKSFQVTCQFLAKERY